MQIKKVISLLLVLSFTFGCFGMVAEAASRATEEFSISVPAGKVGKSKTAYSLEASESVTIKASYTPASAEIDVGLIDSKGIFHYVSVSGGSINKTIDISKRGSYYLAFRNNSDVSVKITGYVTY